MGAKRLLRFGRVVTAGACLVSALLGAGACARGPEAAAGSAFPSTEAPRYRGEGQRLPAFTGRDPSARGWVKVDDLLWIEARDLRAWRAGLVFDGERYVPVGEAVAPGTAATRGWRLRTDHVSLSTNASWGHAVEVAREAERHVVAIVAQYGDVLDLRVPADPLPVTVTASRREFEAVLRGRVSDPVDWGAFYDAGTGIVTLSVEPAARGALPWRADLRHEMTHQILDLSRPPGRRLRTLVPPGLWLWEAFAVWSEGLGDAPGTDTGHARIVRFQQRHAWNDWTPLATLTHLDQAAMRGRHYDQTASVMRFAMADPRARQALLDALARLLAAPRDPGPPDGALGLDLADLERRWRATVGR